MKEVYFYFWEETKSGWEFPYFILMSHILWFIYLDLWNKVRGEGIWSVVHSFSNLLVCFVLPVQVDLGWRYHDSWSLEKNILIKFHETGKTEITQGILRSTRRVPNRFATTYWKMC